MKLKTSKLDLNLKHTFRISRESSDVRNNVLVEIKHQGLTGFGEAAPSPHYNESADSVIDTLSRFSLEGYDDVFLLEDILNHAIETLSPNWSAISALDMALHDLVGKKLGVPLYQLWGLNPAKTPQTSFTIGIADKPEIQEKTREADKYPILKVKLGTDNDEAIIAAIREITGKPIRVDANAAWKDPAEARLKIEWLAGRGIEFVEQPMPERSEAMNRLKQESPLPLFSDEDSRRPEDVPRLADSFHGINIKLTKCGGLREALKMIHIARSLKMQVMLGCMIESSLGITAAAHLLSLVDFADLDGHLLIQDDPFAGVSYDDGYLRIPDLPGIGVTRNPQKPQNDRTPISPN
ncbi:MAG: dipeptide epimerase [Planctomycetota bacterium]|nr:dipeptide epimerase [Planctomycetota bacterium]MDP7249082.1 dipeptide epimerase [Planctomycetota bacterium]